MSQGVFAHFMEEEASTGRSESVHGTHMAPDLGQKQTHLSKGHFTMTTCDCFFLMLQRYLTETLFKKIKTQIENSFKRKTTEIQARKFKSSRGTWLFCDTLKPEST